MLAHEHVLPNKGHKRGTERVNLTCAKNGRIIRNYFLILFYNTQRAPQIRDASYAEAAVPGATLAGETIIYNYKIIKKCYRQSSRRSPPTCRSPSYSWDLCSLVSKLSQLEVIAC